MHEFRNSLACCSMFRLPLNKRHSSDGQRTQHYCIPAKGVQHEGFLFSSVICFLLFLLPVRPHDIKTSDDYDTTYDHVHVASPPAPTACTYPVVWYALGLSYYILAAVNPDALTSKLALASPMPMLLQAYAPPGACSACATLRRRPWRICRGVHPRRNSGSDRDAACIPS